jgi:HEPN domain-containing protein
MQTDYERWLEDAKRSEGEAIGILRLKYYNTFAFKAHQAAELALKALQIYRSKSFDRTHELAMLANRVKAPENIIMACEELYPYYTTSRYPDIEVKVSDEKARHLIELSKGVLKWVEDQIGK